MAADRAREQAEAADVNKRGGVNLSAMNTKVADRGSTNAAHLLRRVARTSPETLAAYEAGDLKTARAAAKAAGIRVTETVALGRPATVAKRIAAMGDDYACAVIVALQVQLGEGAS